MTKQQSGTSRRPQSQHAGTMGERVRVNAITETSVVPTKRPKSSRYFTGSMPRNIKAVQCSPVLYHMEDIFSVPARKSKNSVGILRFLDSLGFNVLCCCLLKENKDIKKLHETTYKVKRTMGVLHFKKACLGCQRRKEKG